MPYMRVAEFDHQAAVGHSVLQISHAATGSDGYYMAVRSSSVPQRRHHIVSRAAFVVALIAREGISRWDRCQRSERR